MTAIACSRHCKTSVACPQRMSYVESSCLLAVDIYCPPFDLPYRLAANQFSSQFPIYFCNTWCNSNKVSTSKGLRKVSPGVALGSAHVDIYVHFFTSNLENLFCWYSNNFRGRGGTVTTSCPFWVLGLDHLTFTACLVLVLRPGFAV